MCLQHPVKTENIILCVRFQPETDDTLEKGHWRESNQGVSKETARDDAVPLPTCGQRGGRPGSKYTGLCLLPPSDPLLMLSISFPHSSVGKESACNARDPVWSLHWEDSLEKRKATPVFWPGEFHGLYRPCGRRVRHDWATFTYFTHSLHQLSSARREWNLEK